MNSAFAEVDGKPVLVQPEHVNFGLAIDLPKPDGSRSLVVAYIKGAEEMDFAGFWAAYEDVIRRARAEQADDGGLHRDDDQPDQPGHDRHQPLGAAADRRPGRDHRRRRHGVPGRVPGDEPRRAHRDGRLEDHHADLDLRPPDHPGRGVRRLPAPPARAAAGRGRLLRQGLPVAADPLRAGALDAGRADHARGADRQGSPGHRGHRVLPAQRPPHGRHRPARVQGPHPPRPRHPPARPDAVGPRPEVPGRRLRRRAADGAARHPRRPAQLLLPHRRRGVHAHHRSRGARVAPAADRGQARAARPGEAEARARPAQRRRGVRDVPADQVRRPEAVQPRGRRVGHPDPRRGADRRHRPRPRRGRDRHGPPRPAQRPGQRARQELREDLRRVRGQHRPRHASRAPATSSTTSAPRARSRTRSSPTPRSPSRWPATRATSRRSTPSSRASSAPSRT